MGVVIKGDKELLNRLKHMTNKQTIENGLEYCCLLVENEAKTNCPVDNGQLRASITHEVEDGKGYVGSNLEYAPYVEYGTGLFADGGGGRTDVPWVYRDAEGNFHSTLGQKPQPFLIPALKNNRQRIVEILGKEIMR